MEDTDIALMARIKEGDTHAFELLLSRHQRSVYNLAFRFLNDTGEAEDITQETFIRVHRAAASYSPEAKFTTWLFTIVKNLCFNVLRRKRGTDVVSLEEESVPDIPAASDNPLVLLEKKQVSREVRKAVAALPENLRMAVLLKKFYGLSYEEIARIFGCTPNAVKLRVHRAKEFLASELGNFSPGPKDETS